MRSAFVFGLLLAGCASSNEAARSDTTNTSDASLETGAPPACVDYDGPTSDGWLPVDGAGSGASFPTCAKRCGAAIAFDGFPRAEALPSGSCTGSTTCDLGAVPRCGCAEDRGPVNSYRCTCAAGLWSCRIVMQGGSICRTTCPGDAALEAEAEADASASD